MALEKTRFRDIANRERNANAEIVHRHNQLQKMKKNSSGRELTQEETKELDRLNKIIKVRKDCSNQIVDPLMVSARQLFKENGGLLKSELVTHKEGVLQFKEDDVDESIVKASLILGLMIDDDVTAPPVKPVGSSDTAKIQPDMTHIAWNQVAKTFFAAVGEARGMHDLAKLVLPILAHEGDSDDSGPNPATVEALEFAQVMRELGKRRVTAKENQLSRRVNEALDRVQSVGADGPLNDLGINLPDLDEVTDNDIIAENVKLMGPMIVSHMFDELKVYQAVDVLVERFQDGNLTIGSGEAGELLYKYWREAPNRMSEMERRTFYATTMGVPGGNDNGFINREFNELWLRFVSSVSEFVRQHDVDKLLRASLPGSISQQQVRKAARDLAANLSLHGYGMAYYAALELQDQIKFMIKLLDDNEIKSAVGARDMWQVVDQIATLELGGAKTSSRYRILATCGNIITQWLSDNVKTINSATEPLLRIEDIRYPKAKPSGQRAATHPDDYDLVNACELWLADMGTSDSRIEEMAQPRVGPARTSSPVRIPSVARDLLDDIGIGLSAQNQ